MAKVKRKQKPYKLILTQDVLKPLTIAKGDRLGKLTIISDQPQIIDHRKVYYVSCICGNVLYMNGLQWLRQEKKSCGQCIPYKIQGSKNNYNPDSSGEVEESEQIEEQIEEIEIEAPVITSTTTKTNNFNIYEYGKAKAKNQRK